MRYQRLVVNWTGVPKKRPGTRRMPRLSIGNSSWVQGRTNSHHTILVLDVTGKLTDRDGQRGMNQIRRQFCQRNQDEGSLVQSRVRDLQVRLLHGLIPV